MNCKIVTLKLYNLYHYVTVNFYFNLDLMQWSRMTLEEFRL